MSEVGMINAYDALERICGDVPYTAEERYYEMLDEVSIAVVNYRVAHGMSQKQLADYLGISQAMVSKYESGDYNISLKALVELFDKLSLDLNISIGKSWDRAKVDPGYTQPEYRKIQREADIPVAFDKTPWTAA